MRHIYKTSIILAIGLLLLAFGAGKVSGQVVADFFASTTSTCVGETVTFYNNSSGTTGNTTYLWSFGVGANPSTITGTGPHDVTYETTGTKTVSLTIVEGSETSTKTRNNYITVSPAATITLTSGAGTDFQSVCSGNSLEPITYSITEYLDAVVIDLPIGVGYTKIGNVIEISGSTTSLGTHLYRLVVLDNCFNITEVTGSITVIPIPTPVLISNGNPGGFCEGTSVTFTSGGGISYEFFVNGSSVQPNGPQSTYTTTTLNDGDYVGVRVTYSTGCTAYLDGDPNIVFDAPNTEIYGPTAVCGFPTSMYTTALPYNPSNEYYWSVTTGPIIFPGVTSNTITVSWPANPPVMTATITLTETSNQGCETNKIINVVKAPETVPGTLTQNQSICEGFSSVPLVLTGNTGNILWQSRTGLDWVDIVGVATNTYHPGVLTETTQYRVIVQSGSCIPIPSTPVTITVVPAPDLVITNPTPRCAPATFNLTDPAITAGSTASLTLTYWTNAEATLALSNPWAVGPGTYYIKGTYPSPSVGCYTIEPVTVVETPKPNLVITPNSNPVCLNDSLRLTLTGQEGSVWSWIQPPNTLNINPVLLFPEVGTHTYSATATNLAGCTATTTITVGVLPLPVVSITSVGGTDACVGLLKTYNATYSSTFTYKWFVNDVEKIGAVTNVFSNVTTGTLPIEIKVKATNSLTGCSSYSTMTVNPIQSPELVMTASKLQLCEGDQTAITLSSPSTPPVYFVWGDGLTGLANPRIFKPKQDTTISASVYNITNCITNGSVTIIVRDTLAFSINASNNGAAVCTGNEVTFTGPPGTDYSYQWYVNGSLIANATARTFIRSFDQNSIVRLIVTDNDFGCSGSATVAITTKNAPVVNLGPDQQVCENNIVTLTGPTGTGYTYAWFKNAEIYPFSDNDSIDYKVTAGATLLRLHVTSPEGCLKTDEITLTSKAIPGITLTANDYEVCVGDAIVLTYATTGATGTFWWDNVTGINPRTVVPQVGNVTNVYWVEAVNALGCTSRASVEVNVNVLPEVVLNVQGGSNNICINTMAVVNGPVVTGYQYQWYKDGVAASGINSSTFSFPMQANTQVSLRVTNSTGCTAESLPLNLQVINLPGIILNQDKDEICLGDSVTLTIDQQNISSYIWQDGLGGDLPSRTFIPASTATFSFSVSGVHNTTSCVSRDTAFVTVRPAPVALINNPAQTVVCEGQTVTLTTSVLANHQYKWMVAGDSLASGATFAFVALQTTDVVLVAKNQYGCEETDTLTITVEDAPNVDLGADVAVCTNYTYTLTGPQNENYTYKWYVNNQLIANNTFEYSFIVTQAVTVRLEVKVGNCTTTDQIVITPLAVPGITLTAYDYEVCVSDTIVLTYATTGATGIFWWDNVSGINPRRVVPQVGNVTNVFWVEAVNALGCTFRDSVEVKVNALPEVVLNVQGGSNNICINTMAVVNGPVVAGYQYQWYKDGMASGTNSSTFSFPMQANTQVSLRVTNSTGCTAESLPLNLQVINLPGIILNQDKDEICLGESVTLTIDQQNISSYIWQDGLGGNLPSRTFTPASTATFSFSVSGVHNTTSCISRDTAFVTVRPAPVAQINNPAQTVCEGQTVTLTTSALANHQYKWMVAGDSLASGATFAFAALQTTDVVLVAKNQYGCEETDTLTITVEDAPNVNLGADVTVCTNYTYTLTGPQNENYTYKWYVNNQLIANNTFEYSFIVTQAVTIRLEVKLGNCTTIDQIVITPMEVPVINVTANNAAICFGEPVVLSLSTQNASSYVWWDGFTGLTTRTIVPVENDTTLAYWAEAINSLGCKSRDTVLVRVNPLPSVPLTVAGGSNIVCYNAVATVQGPQVAGHQYEWFIDDVATGTNTYQLSFTVTKDVTVKLRVTDANGCKNTNQIAIQSRNLPGILLSPDSLDVCIGDSYTLVINNQNVNSYSWFDGLAGNLLQRTFEATTTGSFAPWVEGINSFGCVSRDTAFITVNALPDIFILAPGGTTVCQGEEITLVGSGLEDDIYQWYVNDLLVNNTSTYTFVADQTTDVSLIVTNVAGCQQTDVITINVLDAPEVDLGADLQVCEGYVLTFTGPLDAAHSYGWYINNTLMSTDSSYSFVVTGNINLRLDVTSPDGCSASDTLAITTLPSPAINVTPDNTEFCLGETATLSLTTNGSSYIWWDGLGTNVPTRSFTPTVGDSTYAYWAKAVSLNGCTSSDTAYVKVNNHPVIDIAIQGLANTFCFGSQATIVGPSVEGYTYQWYVNGLEAGENTDRLIFAVTSESLVKLEVTDANGCFGADSLTVFMHTAPGILLSPDSLDICIGESFTLTIDPINVLSFAWWDGLAGNQTNRTITPTIPDMTYMYWAQGINSIGCISFDTAYITVHSLPAAVLLTPLGTSICQGETMILQTPVEEGYTYEWIVDGDTLSTEAQLEFVAETSVSVTLIVTNEFNCSTSETVEIEVFITPVIAFGDDIFACLNEKVVVEGPIGTGFTYEWLLNGVNTGVTSPTFEYEVVDTVSIVLNMNTTNGCVASDTIVITPLLTPKVTIDVSADAFCLGESVTLTATVVDAVAFEWWDGFTNPVRIITPETSGITHYWAEVTSAANCVSRDSISLIVHPNPEIQLVIFEGTPEVCEGGSITFAVSDNAGIEIDYVVWDNDVTVPMGDEPVLYFDKVFNESSWFFAEMVSINGCSVSDSIFITVEPLPEMTISNDTTVCSGETVILESSGGILCIWSDETGMVGAGYTLEIQATETKTYYATIIGDGNLGCSQTDSVTVTVYPLPELMVEASQQNVCGGTPIVLVASGADSYVWSTGQTGTVITVYPLQTTTYSVTGINESGCSQVALVTVNIIPTPVVTLVGLEEFYCTTAEPAVLTGTPAGGIYSGGIGVIGGKFYPSIAGQGVHQVVYSYVNSFGCTGSDTLQTTVVGISEVINLGENAIICPHEEVVFDAGPGYQKYFWSTGDTTRTTTISGNTYFAGTTRTITVIATIQECSVMGSVELTIRNDCYIGIDEIETKEDMVLIPNPSRGEFIIQHKGGEGELQVSIFDGRSGNVYAGTFETCLEDGRQCKVDLSHLPKGVYMVSIIRGDRRFVRKMVIM